MTLKDTLLELFPENDAIKKEIALACEVMPVPWEEKNKYTVGSYIFPQLMKAEVTQYVIGDDYHQKRIVTNMADIVLSQDGASISWSIQAIIKTKSYLNKQ